MEKQEVEAGLTALADEVAEARAALERGDDEIGLSDVGPRIERLCAAATRLAPEESVALQPLMTRIRDELQELSDMLGRAIEEARTEENGDEGGADEEATRH
ncbi:MAG: hypothetical protein NXI21_10700 [Alphaproteobacteria bacterium]|nr:hypothetical protein [Alphaproteobacteria bacterium]